MSTKMLPLPEVPPEVEAFAAEKGASEYLPRVLEFVRGLFPEAPLVVQLYEDPEIHELRKILIEVQVPFETDFAKDVAPGHDAWSRDIVKVCPKTHTHVFGITFEPVL